jgi:hypothetical protein
MSLGKSGFQSIKVEGDRVRLPLCFDNQATLSVAGLGIRSPLTRIFKGSLPSEIRVTLQPPMILGKIHFPEGVDTRSEVSIHLTCIQSDGGQGTYCMTLRDGATEFTIRKFKGYLEKYRYRLDVKAPGCSTWTSKEMRFAKDSPPRELEVRLCKH